MGTITEKQQKFIMGTLHELNLIDQRFRIMQECEGIIKIQSLNDMSKYGAQTMIQYLLKEAEKKGIKLSYYIEKKEFKRKRIGKKSIDVLTEKRRKIVIAICYQKNKCLEKGKFKTQLLDELCIELGPHKKLFNEYSKEELQDLIDFFNNNF
ncbi:MAG: hypothetical protein GY828_06895 [Candidatus Gracilibacteria bacterium]|nr:hypothetical protein [Candidatus Gracilibacteria bacterium]